MTFFGFFGILWRSVHGRQCRMDATVRASISERAFQTAVVELALVFGWSVYHPWMSVRSAAGFPDLVMVRPPRVVFAELKTERGRVTPAQEAWLALLRACPGVEAYLWRPADWEALAGRLE